MWTASRNDQTSIARQLILVENSLNEQKQLIAREQKSVVAWEKTLKAVQGDVDLKWIEENLGPSMFEFFGHDRSYVLDPDLKPIYAMAYGKTIKNRTYESARPQIDPIAKRLREISWQGALSSYIYGHNDNIPNIVDVATIDGKPAIISLMPIASNIRVGNQAPGLEYLHISIEFLDDAIALEIYDLLLLKGGHFNNNYAAPDGEVSFAVHSNSGVLVTNFLWQPSRPGSQMFADTGPAIILAILIAIVIISLLVFRLRRSTATLEAERSAAHHLAYHDKLTGLGNRAMFEKCLEEAIPQAIPGKAELALLILDLDMFKQVNDTLGHQAGDELIREVAKRLHPLVRGTDVITRLGGDEFAIIATGFSCTKDINTMCNRMVKSIREPFNLEAGQAFVGVSIGVSVSADNSDDGEELIRKADIALYEAKNGGRNQFKLFEKQMGETVQKRQKIETDLRNALNSNDQISVEFDPLVRKDGVEILGFEAKIVWEHPLLGIIAPSTFIPVAEYCGLINTVGNLLLKQACEKGAQNPGRFIAVRAFSTSLRNLDYADTVFNIIKETGIAPSDLELEINENMLSDDEAIAANNLRSFRAAGIRIAINDFGSGFTSLRLAQEFQIDRIKISRSFIAEMEQSPDPEAITHAIVWLARAIGVEVSADGVDSVAQKDFLFRMGCMSFQGKVFSSKSQEKWLEIAAKQTSEKTIKCDYEEDEIEVWG
jgi:diguanylate cyclase (GGDEF)-like protein